LKTLIEASLKHALDALPEELVPRGARAVGIEVEHTRDAQHGDFASNLAMRLSRATRQNPRLLAQALIAALPANESIAKVEMAGAGFINFFLKDDAYHQEIGKVLKGGASYGRSNLGAGQRVQVNSFPPIPPGLCTLPTAGTRPSGRRSAIFSRRRATM
jgi:arginyl-tRNA synthetase